MSKIVGIDLGTTNSEVAVVINGKPQLITDGSQRLIPSVVGMTPEGELLVGQAAKNQYILHPDRTVKSIKRKMGTDFRARLGDKEYSPQEISAVILKKLKAMAENSLDEKVEKAVITVPAYFSDAQRQATKDAGEIAGLEVVRIINEPTAAALAYGIDREEAHTALVYDLGGGTFDVSIVELNSGVIEVKASHGNNHLGGDDFDQKIMDDLLENFTSAHAVDLRENLKALARLNKASERVKIRLSDHPFAEIVEEFLAKKNSTPLHLKQELSRHRFNDMIGELIASTGESIDRALKDAELKPADIEKILLVGGSTRIPLVREIVMEKMGKEPHSEINPDEAVALGAAVQAAIIAGEEVEAVLVDVTPYSLGIEVAEFMLDDIYPDRYSVIIPRNTVIPVTKSEVYYPMFPDQEQVRIKVYQGERKTASENVLLGEFLIDRLPAAKAENDDKRDIVVQFDFDVNGILHVGATLKDTARTESITVKAARQRLSEDEKQEAKAAVGAMEIQAEDEIAVLVRRAENVLAGLKNARDREELQGIVASLKTHRQKGESARVDELREKLLDKLYELE
jgi:molecular chaperone DnaK